MSFFSWFSPKKSGRAPAAASSAPARPEASSRPHAEPPATRKHERMVRRELLYAVVREAMVRAGVLSSSYKFKVLSLDPRGRQFLVMIDLARGAGQDTATLAGIEALIAQSASTRHDIEVTAVYWRSIEQVAAPPARPRPPVSRPTPLGADDARPVFDSRPPSLLEVSQPAELAEDPSPERGRGRFEPLHPDEVAAFKKALANGLSASQAVAASAPAPRRKPNHPPGPHSYTLLTGFEDTEMAESSPSQALSGTQYGDLR